MCNKSKKMNTTMLMNLNSLRTPGAKVINYIHVCTGRSHTQTPINFMLIGAENLNNSTTLWPV